MSDRKSRQLVLQALDAWSWFWIGIETTLVFMLAGLALIAGGAYQAGFAAIGSTILLTAIGLPAMRNQCAAQEPQTDALPLCAEAPVTCWDSCRLREFPEDLRRRQPAGCHLRGTFAGLAKVAKTPDGILATLAQTPRILGLMR